MTRTLKKEPAIVITAFGTTTKASATYDYFEAQLKKELPEKYKGYRIEWAFTSEIVRERANKKLKEAGSDKRFLSLPQVLANLDAEGYRKVAIQPLLIFPGQEYEEVLNIIAAFEKLGLKIEHGGTLLHEWDSVEDAVKILEGEFLKPDDGANILVAHGSPETFAQSNATYLGLDRYLTGKYDNVFIGGVDGILTREQALKKAKAYPVKKIKLIPFMYVAGVHIMDDIMGDDPNSWSAELKKSGFDVETIYVDYNGEKLHKGLGFYDDINRMFFGRLKMALKKLEE